MYIYRLTDRLTCKVCDLLGAHALRANVAGLASSTHPQCLAFPLVCSLKDITAKAGRQ